VLLILLPTISCNLSKKQPFSLISGLEGVRFREVLLYCVLILVLGFAGLPREDVKGPANALRKVLREGYTAKLPSTPVSVMRVVSYTLNGIRNSNFR
jgi:hypothetical protein